MNTQVVLEIENLTKLYKNNRGVQDFSLRLEPGDVFGLLGANGAGKTTTMRVITGLARADSGSVRIFGHSVEDEPEMALSRVSSMIEHPAFYEYMSAEKNLHLASIYYGNAITSSKVDSLLELVGLLAYKKEKVSKYSLGMKQRLGLALTLVGDPGLFILDEPLNGLDIQGMVEMRDVILGLSRQEGNSFLISSHLASEIEKTCNKVGIMSEGRLLKIDTMEYILENFPSVEDYFIKSTAGAKSVNL